MDRQKKSIKNLKALKNKQKMEVMYCALFCFTLKPRSNLFEYSTLGTVPVSWMECVSGNSSDHNGNGNKFKKAMSKITLHASHCLTVTA